MLVDTLTIRFNDVVYHEPNLTTQAPSVDVRTGEVAPSLEICGYNASKAFLNTPHLQFTSKAKRLPTGDVIPLEAVKFSVPKVLERDEPCVNLDADDVRGALLIVRDELENNGIFAELLDGSLWRVDATADVQTNAPFVAYTPIFESMHCARFHDANFGTTFRIGGKEKQFCIYNKIAEFKMRGVDVTRMPENVARFEYRMLKAHACRKAGFGDVTALLENYDELRAQTLEAWNYVLERKELSKSAEAFSAFMQLAAHSGAMCEAGRSGTQSSIAENSGTKWLASAERALGLRYLLESGITPNVYYKLLLELGVSRQTASAHCSDMVAVQLANHNANLYEELKTKLHSALVESEN